MLITGLCVSLLCRSKGYWWLATVHSTMMEWSHAGAMVTINQLAPWFASLDEVSGQQDPTAFLLCVLRCE
jgi:hypothetical protein